MCCSGQHHCPLRPALCSLHASSAGAFQKGCWCVQDHFLGRGWNPEWGSCQRGVFSSCLVVSPGRPMLGSAPTLRGDAGSRTRCSPRCRGGAALGHGAAMGWAGGCHQCWVTVRPTDRDLRWGSRAGRWSWAGRAGHLPLYALGPLGSPGDVPLELQEKRGKEQWECLEHKVFSKLQFEPQPLMFPL